MLIHLPWHVSPRKTFREFYTFRPNSGMCRLPDSDQSLLTARYLCHLVDLPSPNHFLLQKEVLKRQYLAWVPADHSLICISTELTAHIIVLK